MPSPSSPPEDNDDNPHGGFAIDIGEDLLAQALAAVESREQARLHHKGSASPEEMDAFASDLVVEEDAPTEEGDIIVSDEDEDEDEADADTIDPDFIEAELARFQALVDEGQAQLEQERQERQRITLIARKLKERAERAEARAEISRAARDAAEERAQRAEDALKQLQQTHDEALRKAAERRRRELDELRQQAPGLVFKELLPVVDNLQLAAAHLDADPVQVAEGVRMIAGQLDGALQRLGIERIEAGPGTPFQPELHEACQQVPTDAWPPGVIVETAAAGYRLQGRLLRAARVSVATHPEPGPDEPTLSESPSAAPTAEETDPDV